MNLSASFTRMVACAAALAGVFAVASVQAGETGKAVVRSVKGSAQYAEGANWLPLKAGQVLQPGAQVRTANDSSLDLSLGENGPLVRLVENTTLGVDKLNFEKTGVDTVIETQLDLKSGKIFGIVRKMAAASKYEIKTPNGVAGIRGTEYMVSATGEVDVLSGSVVVVYVKTDGTVVTQVVNAGETFDPATGTVKAIPADRQSRDTAQLNDMQGGAPAQAAVEQPIVITVSATAGAGSSIRGGAAP